jgi:ATP-binding cassette subfamily F protein 3
MVTHNEMFLHALARRLIIFQNDRIEVFDGSYQRFLDKGGWQDENMTAGRHRQRNLNTDSSTKRTKKELRRQRSEIISERSRTAKPLQERIIKVENRMEKEEAELGRLNLSMQQAAQDQDGSRITEISQALPAISTPATPNLKPASTSLIPKSNRFRVQRFKGSDPQITRIIADLVDQ